MSNIISNNHVDYVSASYSHRGKSSDKWEGYLDIYRKILAQSPIPIESLLEIGIQNGGSLEIWATVLPQAKKIIGTDINPDCSKLEFNDPRISIHIGDATTSQALKHISAMYPNFDLIIDDGSHDSIDIIRAFIRYFQILRDGGTYVVEDLHASYWQAWHGGLARPGSSMNFFKQLTDVINKDHWGSSISLKDFLAQFLEGFSKAEVDGFISSLNGIESIKFLDSVCIVTKSMNNSGKLGSRLQLGENIVVMPREKLAGPIPESNKDELSTSELRRRFSRGSQDKAWQAYEQTVPALGKEVDSLRAEIDSN